MDFRTFAQDSICARTPDRISQEFKRLLRSEGCFDDAHVTHTFFYDKNSFGLKRWRLKMEFAVGTQKVEVNFTPDELSRCVLATLRHAIREILFA